MHTPRKFRVDDQNELAAFMRRNSFCTLVTADDQGLTISHVPLLVDQVDEELLLTGHLAGANPHAARLDGQRSTAVFHGPHSYVSPAWYAVTTEVPTWNYATVHATGPIRTFTKKEALSVLVDRMIETYESHHGNPWNRQLASDYRAMQLSHIVGFEMKVDDLCGKYKLGQNRSVADQDKMLAHLEASPDQDSRALGSFIRAYRRPKNTGAGPK